jgi:hypothetical protein
MPPTSASEIWSFLGLPGYYRWFIKDFSKIAKPMTRLHEKNKDFDWTEECQDSFEELKKRLTSAECCSYRISLRSSTFTVMLHDKD